MALVRQQQLLSFTAGLAVAGASYVATQVSGSNCTTDPRALQRMYQQRHPICAMFICQSAYT